MLKFNIKYFLFAIALFLIEVMIGAYMHDAFIRPYGGDFLVVIFIYCFVRSFWNGGVYTAAMSVLIFSYLVEISQHFHLINKVALQQSKAARIIMGTSFSWVDMLMYTIGMLLVVIIEAIYRSRPGREKIL